MMTTKEIIDILNAYDNGKTIQIFNNEKWEDIVNQTWNFENAKYRVKPDNEYRPYLGSCEFIYDLIVNRGILEFKDKEFTYVNPAIILRDRVYFPNPHNLVNLNDTRIDYVVYTYKEILEKFIWPNGDSCGKKIE